MIDQIRYEVILYWSKADATYIAEVPELPGCVADGVTYQDALAAIEVVIREWIEAAHRLGRPIPLPRADLPPVPLSEAQRQELRRRLADHAANPDDVVPMEEVLERLRQRYP